jgi:hypothetical protein
MSVMAGAGLDWVLNRRTRSWLKMTVATVVVSSVVIEAYKALILVGAPSTTSQSAIAYYRPRRFTDYLQAKMRSEGGLYRVVLRPKDVLPPNLGDVFPPISTLLGHRSSMLKAYFDFLNTDWSLDSPTYDLLGVKYVVSNQPLERLPLVFSDDGLYLYDRPHALPVFQLKFQDGRHEAAQTVSVKWEENSVHLALVTREPTRLVFAQPDFPGWVAEINNKRVPLVRDLIFMSVFVPAGRSEIVFRYAPWWYPVGLALWASILVAFVVSMRGQASSSLAGSR